MSIWPGNQQMLSKASTVPSVAQFSGCFCVILFCFSNKRKRENGRILWKYREAVGHKWEFFNFHSKSLIWLSTSVVVTQEMGSKKSAGIEYYERGDGNGLKLAVGFLWEHQQVIDHFTSLFLWVLHIQAGWCVDHFFFTTPDKASIEIQLTIMHVIFSHLCRYYSLLLFRPRIVF